MIFGSCLCVLQADWRLRESFLSWRRCGHLHLPTIVATVATTVVIVIPREHG